MRTTSCEKDAGVFTDASNTGLGQAAACKGGRDVAPEGIANLQLAALARRSRTQHSMS